METQTISSATRSIPKNVDACNNCGGTDFETDEATGQISCTDCGRIMQTAAIVNEATFNKDSSGATTLNAAFLSSDSGQVNDFQRALGYRSHRQQQERFARQEIDKVCHHLDVIPIAEHAVQYFRRALSQKLTRGRKIKYTIGACLYLACRQLNRPFLLIDFADELDVDVFHLGKAYQLLADKLNLRDHYMTDPTIYIERLVTKIDFKDRADEVREMSVRLVKRMKRDWIDRGRRPTGICGAAIFIAAKAQNFQICFQDIARAAKIGQGTIKKRCAEFENTEASNLSIDEFNRHGDDIENLYGQANPPCFKHEIEQKLDKTFENNKGNLENKVFKIADLLEKQIEETQKSPGSSIASGSTTGKDPGERDRETTTGGGGENRSSKSSSPVKKSNKITESEAISMLTNDVTSINPEKFLSKMSKSGLKRSHNQAFSSEDEENREISLPANLKPTLKDYGVVKSLSEQFKDAPDFIDDRPDEPEKCDEENKHEQNLSSQPETSPPKSITPASTNSKQNDQKHDSLSDIDDSEIEDLILPPEDVKIKTLWWEQENGKYYTEVTLEREKIKREESEKKKQEQHLQKKHKKRKQRQHKSGNSNAGHAIAEVIKQDKLSKKINYSKLISNIQKPFNHEKATAKNTGSIYNKSVSSVNVGSVSTSISSNNPSVNRINSKPFTPATPSEFPKSTPGGYSSQSEDDTETEDEESEIMKKFDRNNADDED